MSFSWLIAAFVMAITIIGLPFVPACLRIARFTLWPFGYRAIMVPSHPVKETFGCLGNIIWFCFAGWWLALGHLTAAVANFITIIGIPFGWQHLKMIRISLAPIGMRIVPISPYLSNTTYENL